MPSLRVIFSCPRLPGAVGKIRPTKGWTEAALSIIEKNFYSYQIVELKMNEDLENFRKYSGEILRLAVVVESSLDYFISNYFCEPQGYKTFLLQDEVFLWQRFERKINLFKKICKEEDVNPKVVKKIVKAADDVRILRNKVAHGQAMINDPKIGIILQKRESTKYKKDELKLTPELVDDIVENWLIVSKGTSEILSDLQKPGRVKKEKIW